DRVLVGVLAEPGHVYAQDPDVVVRHLCSPRQPIGSNPKPIASVPSPSVPSDHVARRTFMPSDTRSGSGGTFTRLARTLVPSQSTTPATNGTGMPGAAI